MNQACTRISKSVPMDVYKTRWDNSQVFSFELYPAQVYMHPDALYCSVIFLLLSSNENELPASGSQMAGEDHAAGGSSLKERGLLNELR